VRPPPRVGWPTVLRLPSPNQRRTPRASPLGAGTTLIPGGVRNRSGFALRKRGPWVIGPCVPGRFRLQASPAPRAAAPCSGFPHCFDVLRSRSRESPGSAGRPRPLKFQPRPPGAISPRYRGTRCHVRRRPLPRSPQCNRGVEVGGRCCSPVHDVVSSTRRGPRFVHSGWISVRPEAGGCFPETGFGQLGLIGRPRRSAARLRSIHLDGACPRMAVGPGACSNGHDASLTHFHG